MDADAARWDGVQCKLFYDTSVIHYSAPVWFGVYPGVKDAFMVGEEAGGLHILEPEGSGYRSTPWFTTSAARN
jgi:hypothetical protein